MKPIRLLAPAKINLTLRVLGRRDDGYHALESLVGFVDFGDVLILDPSQAGDFSVTGPFASALKDAPDNLVLQAHRALERALGHALPAKIELIKSLPVASGIGGGSADAAACLRALAHCYDIAQDPIMAVARDCGADVPVCLDSTAKWMTGIGHDLSAVSIPSQFSMVLVRPPQAVPTSAVFKKLMAAPLSGHEAPAAIPHFSSVADFVEFIKSVPNDLEAAAITIAPEIADVLQRLRALGGIARMSGSGATCFALFAPGEKPADIKTRLACPPDWWVQEARLIGAGDTELNQIEQF